MLTADELIAQLRAEGVLDEKTLRDLALARQPDGEKQIRPGETRTEAVARLQRHYGYTEREAQFAISVSAGWGDVIAIADDGTWTPYPFGATDEDGEDRSVG